MVDQKPGILYVEAREKRSGTHLSGRAIEQEIRACILRNHSNLKIGMQIALESPAVTRLVTSVRVTGYSKSKTFPDENEYSAVDNEIEVTVYSLFTDDDQPSWSEYEDGDHASAPALFESMPLPHESFDGIWESLVYEEPIAEKIFRTLTRAIHEKKDHASGWPISWQNTILLYGPPGSGKTTLAQALAQRLSIRLSNTLISTKFIQVNAHALFSRYFGETAKQIGYIFKIILCMAADDSQLLVVMVDEVESVASSRKLASPSDPADTIRATNEILKGLDRLQDHGNVVCIFTTNLVDNLDPAFKSRCCIKKLVNAPVTDCVFEILRMELNNLINLGLIVFETLIYDLPRGNLSDSSSFVEVPSATSPVDMSIIPTRPWANANWPSTAITAVSTLLEIAKSAPGLSGRTLKRLVTYARYQYLVDEPGDLRDLLVALEAVIREETGPERLSERDRDPTKMTRLRTEERELHAEEDELIDMATWTSQLEAGVDPGKLLTAQPV